jgi:GT2 family glycosyltransferase
MFVSCSLIIKPLPQLPSVAIVILNWNGRKFLESFLPAVLASTYKNLNIVVADNASTDDSITFIREHYPQIRVIINKVNYGFAKGYNIALEQVEADYYILLNTDVEVRSDWIEPVIDLMESDKFIAAAQPKILSFYDKTMFEYAGASGGWIDCFGYPFCRGRVFDVCESDIGQYDNTQQIFWASGAALFVRAKTFHELNGFDEYFFAHQEEIDLCWRMQLSGYKIFVEPKSIVYHVGGGSLPTGNKRKVFLNFRNNLIMLYKNIPLSKALWIIPLRFILDNIAAFKNLVTGNLSAFEAILKAQLSFYKWILVEKNKKWIPKNKKIGVYGKYSGLLLWEYYINKKRTFSKIVKNKK